MELTANKTPLLLIALFAFALRAWTVANPPYFIGDEPQFIPAAENFIENGQYAPTQWLHPPLHFHLTALGIKLFGNNPYGWRMPNVIFGSLSVLVLMLLAMRLFSDKRIAWLSGIFFSLEPFHVVLSRTNFMEIAPVFFFLLYAYAIAEYLQGDERALAWSGIPLGLALAGKWYFVLPFLAVSAVLLYQIWRGGTRAHRVLDSVYVASSGITAVGVYLLLMYPWFTRGSSLTDLVDWQIVVYHRLQSIDIDFFADSFFRSSPALPLQWFIRPLIATESIFAGDGWGRFFTFMNNPPVWILVLPAFAYLLFMVRKQKDPALLLTGMLFASSYAQFVLVTRPVFLYSSFPALPFAYLIVAWALVRITGPSITGRKILFLIACIELVWGLYLYPFATGRSVPLFLYSHFLP